MAINLWLDDIRSPLVWDKLHPEGYWKWVTNVEEAIDVLSIFEVNACSLDHDMGWCPECESKITIVLRSCPKSCECKCHWDGTYLVKWMIKNNIWPKQKPYVHSMNPTATQRMRSYIDDFGPYQELDTTINI